MDLIDSMFKYAFIFDLILAVILFVIVSCWLRAKRR